MTAQVKPTIAPSTIPATRKTIAAPEIGRIARRAGSPLAVLLLWEILGRSGVNILLPSFTKTLAALWTLLLNGQLTGALGLTTLTLVVGLALALLVGLPLGLAMGRYPFVARLAGPYVAALMTTPSVGYIPLLVIWLGTDLPSRIVVVFVFAFFPVVTNTEAGVRNADARLVEMARSFLGTPHQIFLKVVVPGAMPLILAGVRLAVGRAVKGVVMAEMLITIVGLGGLIRSYGNSFQMDSSLALTVSVVMFALLLTALLRVIDRSITRWMPEVSRR